MDWQELLFSFTNATLKKQKEDLEEISTELELADEDEKVPYAMAVLQNQYVDMLNCSRYKIGDSFFSLPVPEVQELLSSSVEKIDGDVSALEEKMSGLNDEMQDLKAALYGRFGRSINLET